MRHYATACGLFILAGLILRAGLDIDMALPTVVDSRLQSVWIPPQFEALRPHKVTAYCACPLCCGGWSDGITASGAPATQGRTIAADVSRWDIGTCLIIPGVGRRVVEDTGSAIRGRTIDVFFASHEAALAFGVRWLHVRECDA